MGEAVADQGGDHPVDLPQAGRTGLDGQGTRGGAGGLAGSYGFAAGPARIGLSSDSRAACRTAVG
ncbi:hypothetical protein [Streptomyces sp. NRRL S-337]|uniref:hypothetical protein n=1 Tax=Streptomyces sp. NRRL S-337 TaxID=1463900 RepID=UPI0004C54E14|nr:hypothetical protein [Streptomyces sp. NRRL S-337]